MPEWVSVREAAQISGYSLPYVQKLARTGRVKAKRVGPIFLIDQASLQAYLDEVRALGTQRFNWRRKATTRERT